jgi:hypothetical protein
MQKQGDRNKGSIALFFEGVRELIDEREAHVRRQVEESLAREVIEGKLKLAEIREFLESVEAVKR